MAKINLLKPEVFNLISAGEVIETPQGAIKELVENSIDAGANRITIEVRGGGFELISVADNGCGIAEEDVDLAFAKHATSKVQTSADIFQVQTLGFRGEALSSIAAVAKVKLTTKTADATSAVCVQLADGVVAHKDYVSANNGTTIEIRDLFYNTPARKKFFKSPAREATDITKFVAKLILTNPNLAIKYVLDGGIVYQTPGSGLSEALYSVYGADCVKNVVRVTAERGNMKLNGYVGNPTYCKPNRTYQTFSVNGRCVTDIGVSSSVAQAYKSFLMVGKFPFFVLDLTMPFTDVDVNVHPKKSEVRFADSHAVCSFLYHAVGDALRQYVDVTAQNAISGNSQMDVNVALDMKQISYFDQVDDFITNNDSIEIMNPHQLDDVMDIEEATQRVDDERAFEEFADKMDEILTVQNMRYTLGMDTDVKQGKTKAPLINVFDEVNKFNQQKDERDAIAAAASEAFFSKVRILGVAFRTYLILEVQDKVIFIDQHAAHERLLFDKLMANKSNNMQDLLFPYTFTVSPEEAQFILDNRQNILAAGIEVESFGINSFRIKSVKEQLVDGDMRMFVNFLLASIEEYRVDDSALLVEKLARQACKSAVKAGEVLNEYQIRELVQQIYDNKVLVCPHGRPITAIFTKTQLEKMFKRIV